MGGVTDVVTAHVTAVNADATPDSVHGFVQLLAAAVQPTAGATVVMRAAVVSCPW
ncbi:hypothetical protein OG912_39960 (plasmid) [Streptomyces sp. NBC_00464]|uniref:hypothetical protein n=1 Tax=Streptomyces sp. NBC_00464 TaxID=2975751 RepID=UPI002E183DFC